MQYWFGIKTALFNAYDLTVKKKIDFSLCSTLRDWLLVLTFTEILGLLTQKLEGSLLPWKCSLEIWPFPHSNPEDHFRQCFKVVEYKVSRGGNVTNNSALYTSMTLQGACNYQIFSKCYGHRLSLFCPLAKWNHRKCHNIFYSHWTHHWTHQEWLAYSNEFRVWSGGSDGVGRDHSASQTIRT